MNIGSQSSPNQQANALWWKGSIGLVTAVVVRDYFGVAVSCGSVLEQLRSPLKGVPPTI